MIQTIVIAVLLLCIGYPALLQITYMIRTKLRGLTNPPVTYSFPLGIPQQVCVIKSVRGYYMNKRNMDILLKEPSQKTVRLQMVSGFSTMTTDPENLKAILTTQFKDFGHDKRHTYFFPLFGDGIFTLDGQGWQHTRALLRPQFTREQISHVHITEQHVQRIISMFKQNEKACEAGTIPIVKGVDGASDNVGRKDEYIDIMPLFFKMTIDTATEFLFGESVGLLDGGNPKVQKAVEFGNAFNSAQEVLLRKVALEKYYWLVGGKQFQQWCDICKDFAMSYVQLALQRTAAFRDISEPKKEEKSKDAYVFLDELAKETRDPIMLRDQAINVLVAGRDTTASLLSWTLLMLARHKPVFYKLRQVIIEEFGNGEDVSNITFESLKRCEYLRYVLNETLRLYPTVPNNFRYALKDTSLPRGGGKDGTGPIFIPKNSIVLYSVYCMHRNPTIWGYDSQKFRPERWASQSSTHTWSYLPFNGGPRICLGQQFALTEVGYAVCRILQNFREIEGHPSIIEPESPRELTSLTLSPADGVYIKLIT